MIRVFVVSNREEIGDKLEKMCKALLRSEYNIERFSSGIESAEHFRSFDPDLAFVSANLPDVDGSKFVSELKMRGHECRFILIFERGAEGERAIGRALENEIKECIFFPFSKEEISYTLQSAERLFAAKKDTEFQLARSIRSLRNSFMDRFFESDSVSSVSAEMLNLQYHMNLSAGVFQVAIIRFPGLVKDGHLGRYQMMLDGIVADARRLLDSGCFEMVPFVRRPNTIIMLANYATSKSIDREFRSLLEVTKKNIEIHCGFNLPFVIGIGSPEYDCIYLKRAFRTAQYAERCRLLFGDGQVFFYDDYSFEQVSMEGEPIQEGLLRLAQYVEMLDAKGASYEVYKVMSVLTPRVDPACASELCERIGVTVIKALNNITQNRESAGKLLELVKYLDMGSSLSGLKVAVSEWVQERIQEYLDVDDQVMLRPIREAKQYINQNYNKRLTLQNVAEKIGLSATYFCSMFREEVGETFLNYLTGIRIEEAKHLLRETDLDIATISERVGYSDSRYFSRVFFKALGVQPTAYRNLDKKRTS